MANTCKGQKLIPFSYYPAFLFLLPRNIIFEFVLAMSFELADIVADMETSSSLVRIFTSSRFATALYKLRSFDFSRQPGLREVQLPSWFSSNEIAANRTSHRR
jgi:hypothetical protein